MLTEGNVSAMGRRCTVILVAYDESDYPENFKELSELGQQEGSNASGP
jgi:hypothetical protein